MYISLCVAISQAMYKIDCDNKYIYSYTIYMHKHVYREIARERYQWQEKKIEMENEKE